MIRFTPEAADRLTHLLRDKEDYGLRLIVEDGGCAGRQYRMAVDRAKEGDAVFQTEGGMVFINEKSLPLLSGAVVDFSDSLEDSGFRIENPNAVRSCGCGTSFERNS